MSSNLYETLGVEPTATDAEIRSAYRKAAKTEHPDSGGSSERFHAITAAHRILGDKDKRAKYDATGETADQPDQKQARAMDLVAQTIVTMCETEGMIYRDVIAEAKKHFDMLIGQQKQAKRDGEKAIEKQTKMRARFKAKEGRPDRIGMILDQRIASVRNTLKLADENIEILELAKVICDDNTFEPEVRPKPKPPQSYYTTVTGMGGMWNGNGA